MCDSIQALYSNAQARVHVNSHLSDALRLSNGARQVFPLSPLLFVLSLEPFLNKLSSNPDIHGISVCGSSYKVAAFVSDLLLFLSQPRISLSNLLKELELFKNVSNLKINYSKSQALNISLSNVEVEHCQANFPFQWSQEALTYLGIKIPSKWPDLDYKNHLNVLEGICKEMRLWQSLNIA